MPTLNDALRELARRRPLALNQEVSHATGGEIKSLKFADDHEFVVVVPSWVFRVIEDEIKIHSQS